MYYYYADDVCRGEICKPLFHCKSTFNHALFDFCHAKPTLDKMKFINFSCLKIKQNHSSSCSLPVITYESILGFSYKSSLFMQIRLKKVLLAVLLLKNLAKYNKEINMTVKFLLITFKQSCVIICCQEILKFWVFWKNLYKYHFWLGGLLEEKFSLPNSVSCQWRPIFKGSFMQNFMQIGQFSQKLCRFFNFFSGWLVGLFVLLDILWDTPEFRWWALLI